MVCLKREEDHSPSYRTTPCTELAVKLNIFVPSFFVHQWIQSILMIKQHLWTCFTWHISYWSLWLEVPAMPIALLSLKALIRLDCQPSTVTERRPPVSIMHDDVIKWKHFPRNWPFVQRPVTRSFDVFFDLRLNKRLSKQPWGWWFETLSWSLWRQCNGVIKVADNKQDWYHHMRYPKKLLDKRVVVSIFNFTIRWMINWLKNVDANASW